MALGCHDHESWVSHRYQRPQAPSPLGIGFLFPEIWMFHEVGIHHHDAFPFQQKNLTCLWIIQDWSEDALLFFQRKQLLTGLKPKNFKMTALAWARNPPRLLTIVFSWLLYRDPRREKATILHIYFLLCVVQSFCHFFPKAAAKGSFKNSVAIKDCHKDCHQTSPKVKTVIKDCHQTSPKVLLKWWLSLRIVIKHRPKFYWSDGCRSRLSSKTAQSKDCH